MEGQLACYPCRSSVNRRFWEHYSNFILPREWFPRDATGQDFQTQQYFDISLIVHKSLIQENGDPIVEIDGNEKQLGKTTVGDYFHYSAFSLDNDWLITPSTQEKQVLISVDGGGQYQLIYNIQVE